MAESYISRKGGSSGNAVAADLLSGKTATVSTGDITGTMPNNGTVNITPSTTNQTIAQGYHSGSGVVYGDSDLVAGNIKSGVNIFGVTGNFMPSMNIQNRQYRDVNFIGTRTQDIDIGYARPCYAYVSGMNRYQLWIYGSNDASNWTQLANISIGENADGGTTAYTTSYRYIRLAGSGINNGGDNELAGCVVYI